MMKSDTNKIKKASNNKNDVSKKILSLQRKISELKKENNKIKKNKASDTASKYRSLFEMSDNAILVIENGKFVDCNKAVVKMLGYKTKKELLNTHPSQLSPLKQPDGRLSHEKAEEMISLAIKNGSNHFEWVHTKANGENFYVEVWLCALQYKSKTIINTIWRDLTEIKKAEEIILKNITEKEILLKEIHHRVKNNLQIICSLLNLQASKSENRLVKSVLLQSKSRVESMSKIHEMLYKTNDFGRINFSKYVFELANSLIYSIKGEIKNINLKIEITDIYFPLNTAIPLALLINEIITNSLKHGIIDEHKGEIFVSIKKKNNTKYEIQIGDNGVGTKVNINEDKVDSLGFQLINSLCKQLNGVITNKNCKNGTCYKIIFELI